MSTYRYLATDLISGQVLADNLPLNVQSFGMQLSGTGQLTGSLDLQGKAIPNIAAALAAAESAGQSPESVYQSIPPTAYQVNAPYVAALECGKSVLWVLMDGYPVWCGIVWDWPDMTRQQGGPLTIGAQTIDSLWTKRLITDTLNYPQVDLFTVFLDLVKYGMSKNSPYISSVSPAATRAAGYLALFASNGGVANLVLPTGPAATSGIPWTASYMWSDETQISDAWSNMTQAGNFDYVFLPGLASPNTLGVFVTLGYTQLGRPLAESGYSLTYPGNVLDYGYQRTGSQGANYIWGTAPPNGSAQQWESQFPYGADLANLAEGYPIQEVTVSWDGSYVTSQAQINVFAQGQLPLYSQAMTTPTITVGGDGFPLLTDIVLGDTCWFSATSPLHPPRSDNSPGLQAQVRITGWSCTPPGPAQSESYQLTTSLVSQR